MALGGFVYDMNRDLVQTLIVFLRFFYPISLLVVVVSVTFFTLFVVATVTVLMREKDTFALLFRPNMPCVRLVDNACCTKYRESSF